MKTASSRLDPPESETSEESVFESEMLYESQSFEYLFSQAGQYTLKVMNIPNVALRVRVSSESPNDASLSHSKMSLSFMSARSLSSFVPNDSFLQSRDHKMNRNRPVELLNSLRPDQASPNQFCDYFGVKSSLLKKYQILNRLFRATDPGPTGTDSDVDSQCFSSQLLDRVELDAPPPECAGPVSVQREYLTLLRKRFDSQHDLN